MGQAAVLPALKVIGAILGVAGAAKSLMTPPPKGPRISSLLSKPTEIKEIKEIKLLSTPKDRRRSGLRSTIKTGFQGLTDLAPTAPSVLGGGVLKDKIGA